MMGIFFFLFHLISLGLSSMDIGISTIIMLLNKLLDASVVYSFDKRGFLRHQDNYFNEKRHSRPRQRQQKILLSQVAQEVLEELCEANVPDSVFRFGSFVEINEKQQLSSLS